MITYDQIKKANEDISYIEFEKGGKKTNYAMVPQRVKAFRMLYPDGFITTQIISNDGTTILMQASAGYYNERGEMVVLGTGFAQEIRGKGMVNSTSHIENCETSAVGRALGFIALGIDGGGICSAEELVNAITAQNQMKQEEKEKKERENEQIRNLNRQNPGIVNSVPEVDKDKNAIATAFASHMNEFMERFGISDNQEALKKFNEFRDSLQKAGVIGKNEKMQSVEEVHDNFEAIYKNFNPSGAKAS